MSKVQVEETLDLATGWKKCKMAEADVQELENMRMLYSRAIIQWHSAEGEDRPYEGTFETVIFRNFVECGFAVLVSDFLHALLCFLGIQLCHLTPQYILHPSIFTHLCEAFLGVLPHFHFFQYFFYLRPIPNASKPANVGGDELVLRPKSESEYLSYQPSGKGADWKNHLFYVGISNTLYQNVLPEPQKHRKLG